MRSKAGLYSLLPTEQPNPRTQDLDLDTPLGIVRRLNREDALVARAVGREAPRLARAVLLVADSLRSGGRLVFVGAGTSGRLGVLEAAECPPTFGVPPGQVRAVMAGGKAAVFRAAEGAEDDAAAGAAAVRRLARRGDVVVGIAASGVTPFVRGALREAGRRRAGTILVTSNSRAAVREAGIVISPRVGPEAVAGSTRMKSGTAAKLVLNTLTTAAMIRLGKVYDRWMVDLRPTNAKLRLRSARIVCHLGRVGGREAAALLAASGGHVKTAILAARLGGKTARARVAQARRLLEAAGGSLRLVLDSR